MDKRKLERLRRDALADAKHNVEREDRMITYKERLIANANDFDSIVVDMCGEMKRLEKENAELQRELDKARLDVPLLTETHLHQIRNRIPISIAKKVDSWPRCLTAVTRLKQERNNANVDVEQFKKENAELKDKLVISGVACEMERIKLINNKPLNMMKPSLICTDCHISFAGKDEAGHEACCPECGEAYGHFFTKLIRKGTFALMYWLEESPDIEIKPHINFTSKRNGQENKDE